MTEFPTILCWQTPNLQIMYMCPAPMIDTFCLPESEEKTVTGFTYSFVSAAVAIVGVHISWKSQFSGYVTNHFLCWKIMLVFYTRRPEFDSQNPHKTARPGGAHCWVDGASQPVFSSRWGSEPINSKHKIKKKLNKNKFRILSQNTNVGSSKEQQPRLLSGFYSLCSSTQLPVHAHTHMYTHVHAYAHTEMHKEIMASFCKDRNSKTVTKCLPHP